MNPVNKTKTVFLTAAMVTALAVIGLQSAVAAPGAMKGPGSQHPCMKGQQLDPETIKARDAFFAETTELRKQMAEKRAAMRALMKGTDPDQVEAAKLAGEIFDLREQIRPKAQAAGLPPRMMMGMMGGGQMMGCDGPMMGGKHHGGKMK
jgi:zinc resistance-associated protein